MFIYDKLYTIHQTVSYIYPCKILKDKFRDTLGIRKNSCLKDWRNILNTIQRPFLNKKNLLTKWLQMRHDSDISRQHVHDESLVVSNVSEECTELGVNI